MDMAFLKVLSANASTLLMLLIALDYKDLFISCYTLDLCVLGSYLDYFYLNMYYRPITKQYLFTVDL